MANKRYAARNTKVPSLLQGLAACSACGYGYYRTSARTTSRKIYYYRCLGSEDYRYEGGRVCGNKPVRADYPGTVVWDHITALLTDPALIRAEISKRLEQARTADPATRQRKRLDLELAKAATSITAMIEAFSEQLLTIDELRAKMPHLRARQANLRGQIDALDAQAADRGAYLKLADDLEGFLAQLRGNAATATVEDRQRVLRLLVKDVLIGPEKIIIRHRIPARAGTASTSGSDAGPDTEGDHRPDYLLRWGRDFPLLANVYLHHVFDLWARQWRNRQARGDVIILRFADDIVVGFQDRSDAERFYADLVDRFARFSLELSAGKTRLIEFGRFAAQNRRRRGLGRPETFDFLGFTHMCGKTRTGRFALRRKTIARRMAAKLREVKALLMQRRHRPITEQGQWLGSVVRGYIAYYAVPGNIRAVSAFRKQVTRHWGRALRRRSQRHRVTWERMGRLEARWLPPARITHPWPNVRFDARTQGRSPVH